MAFFAVRSRGVKGLFVGYTHDLPPEKYNLTLKYLQINVKICCNICKENKYKKLNHRFKYNLNTKF